MTRRLKIVTVAALAILSTALIATRAGSPNFEDGRSTSPDSRQAASVDMRELSGPIRSQTPEQTPAKTVDSVGRLASQDTLVASVAPPEILHRLQPWINEELLVERPYIDSYVLLEVNNQPILDFEDMITLQVDPNTTYVASKSLSQSLPGGGALWAGDIEGHDSATVSVEVSANGETIIRITTGTVGGRIIVRPTPMLPYHIAYKRAYE